jgi:cytochrome c553
MGAWVPEGGSACRVRVWQQLHWRRRHLFVGRPALRRPWPTGMLIGVDATVEAIMAIDGDPAYGEYLGGECATCHRRSGPADGIPPDQRHPEAHFVRAMVEYREKIRANEVMRTTAARLSDEEIAALAAHFAEREPALISAETNRQHVPEEQP